MKMIGKSWKELLEFMERVNINKKNNLCDYVNFNTGRLNTKLKKKRQKRLSSRKLLR